MPQVNVRRNIPSMCDSHCNGSTLRFSPVRCTLKTQPPLSIEARGRLGGYPSPGVCLLFFGLKIFEARVLDYLGCLNGYGSCGLACRVSKLCSLKLASHGSLTTASQSGGLPLAAAATRFFGISGKSSHRSPRSSHKGHIPSATTTCCNLAMGQSWSTHFCTTNLLWPLRRRNRW
jgi:hypothetical protein